MVTWSRKFLTFFELKKKKKKEFQDNKEKSCSLSREPVSRKTAFTALSLHRDHPLALELKLNSFLESFLEIIENGLEAAKYLISNQSSIEIEPLEPIRPIPLEAGIVLGRGLQAQLAGNRPATRKKVFWNSWWPVKVGRAGNRR